MSEIVIEKPRSIIIEHFKKQPNGYLVSAGVETIQSVFEQIESRLNEAGMIDEYFHLDYDIQRRPEEKWPIDARWVVCFAVVGGSEGHYIHVEALWPPEGPKDVYGRRRLLMLGKTFQGWEHAWKMTEFISKLLEDGSWGHVIEEEG